MAYYTLVQHTGWTVAGDPQFKHAVELRVIENSKTRDAVQWAGGLIFSNYNSARARENAENYPTHNNGMIPNVRGRFGPKVNGESIYIPELNIKANP